MSMMFTPKGLSVSVRASSTCSRTQESGAEPQAMMPSPPALLTAAARRASAIHAIAPWMIGCSMPSSSVTRVFMESVPYA